MLLVNKFKNKLKMQSNTTWKIFKIIINIMIFLKNLKKLLKTNVFNKKYNNNLELEEIFFMILKQIIIVQIFAIKIQIINKII